MKVAVLGAGNGGLAVAHRLARVGHQVHLTAVPGHEHNLAEVAAAGGITAAGEVEGFAPIASATPDVGAAMAGAEALWVVGPAFATENFAVAAGPHLRSGMVVVVCPGSCMGAVTFRRAAGLDLHDDSVIVGETSTLPYAVRGHHDRIQVFHAFDSGFWAAAAPRSGNRRLLEVVRAAYPNTSQADSVFHTTLQNGNPVIHPAVTLLNASLIDRTHGAFTFYEEGVTESSGRLMAAVDAERMAVAAALGVSILSEPQLGVLQGYMTQENYTTGYSTAPGFLGIGAQSQVDHRYLTEDVGYGLVFISDLGRRTGVATPTIDSVIQVASVILGRDFRAERARTLETLGMGGMSTEDLLRY